MPFSRREMLGMLAAGAAMSLSLPAMAARKVSNFNRRMLAPPTKTELFGDNSGVPPMLSEATPRLMEEAILRYEMIVRAGGWPQLPRMRRVLVAGSRNRVVRVLRRRLMLEGYLPPEAGDGKRYDKQVAQALMPRFLSRSSEGMPR